MIGIAHTHVSLPIAAVVARSVARSVARPVVARLPRRSFPPLRGSVATRRNPRRNSVAISVALSVRRNFRSSQFPFVAISVRSSQFLPFVATPFVAVVRDRPCPEHIGCSEAEAVRSFVRRNFVRRNSVRSSPSLMKRWRRPSRFDATRRRHRVIMVPAPSRARVAASVRLAAGRAVYKDRT